MRLHLGCGDVYLQGYVNIDIHIEGYSFLASDWPVLVEQNLTTEDEYYKKSYPGAGGYDRKCVADEFMDFRRLRYRSKSIERILAIQCLEHLSRFEAKDTLLEWKRVLEFGGTLVIDVPDFERIAQLLLAQKSEKAKDYYYKMIFGSHKNPEAGHKEGYSYEKLCNLLIDAGFMGIINLGNRFRHPYPSVCIEAIKEK